MAQRSERDKAIIDRLSFAELVQYTESKLDALKLDPLAHFAESERATKAEVALLRKDILELQNAALKAEKTAEETNEMLRGVMCVAHLL